MKGEGAGSLEGSRHRAERFIMLDDLSSQVANMDLVRSSEMAGGHDPERTLVQGEIRELAANFFEEGLQSLPVRDVGSSIQAPNGFEVRGRALAAEA
jgi:hypothetical protein